MTIMNFYTLQAGLTGQSALPDAGLGAGLGLGASTGSPDFAFLEILAASIEASKQESQSAQGAKFTAKEQHALLQSDNPALDKSPELDLAKLLADNPEIAEQIEKFSIGGNATLGDVLALNQMAFDEIMRPIEISPEELTVKELMDYKDLKEKFGVKDIFFIDGQSDHKPALEKLRAILKKLEQAAEENDPKLIAADLSPAQITALQEFVTSPRDEDATEPDTGIFVGIIKLVPPEAQAQGLSPEAAVIIAPRALTLLKEAMQNGSLNDLTGAPAANSAAATQGASSAEGADFQMHLKQAATTNHDAPAQADAKVAAPQPDNAINNISYLQGWPFTLDGSLFAPVDWTNSMIGELGLQTGANAANITGLQNLTNLVTHAPSATAAHPATQTIAAAMKKSAGEGQDTRLTLQLDPPELGRVEVRMNFGKDKSIKTIMTVEKPEAFTMLQRDAHILEKTLQDAGLDVSDGSLSFELAQDGREFSHDGGHDGSRNKSAAGQQESTDDMDIIETTMTWHLDPETGHMRYNIMA